MLAGALGTAFAAFAPHRRRTAITVTAGIASGVAVAVGGAWLLTIWGVR